jgi:hypothetical protein
MGDAGIQSGAFVDLLYSPMWSEWGGTKALELRLRDVRVAAPDDTPVSSNLYLRYNFNGFSYLDWTGGAC